MSGWGKVEESCEIQENAEFGRRTIFGLDWQTKNVLNFSRSMPNEERKKMPKGHAVFKKFSLHACLEFHKIVDFYFPFFIGLLKYSVASYMNFTKS